MQMNQRNGHLVAAAFSRAQMGAELVTALIAGIAAVLTAFLTGLWQWWSGRKKADVDAQAALVSGFVALLGEFKTEREQLVKRVNECEANSQRQDRHISKLERVMSRHEIKIPKEEED
jgi:hypothetical protein